MAVLGWDWRSSDTSSSYTEVRFTPTVRESERDRSLLFFCPEWIPSRAGLPPTQRPSEAAAGRSQSTDTTLLKSCRALVVDDDADTRELIAVILGSAGAVVQTASSVSEALRHLKVSQFDVVLADIGMPGVDGYAFIREVRESEIGTDRHLPAAAITAYAGHLDRERALAAGFDRHIPKPISPAEVIDAVLSLCKRLEHD